MVKYSDDDLDTVFAALADRTRRHVLQSLAGGDRQVTELANEHEMSLPGFMKHLRVLEDAGLMVRTKEGRTVHCELAPQALEDAAMWLAHYEKFWNAQLDALGRYLYHQEEIHPWPRAPKPARSQTAPASGSAAVIRLPRKKSGGRGPTRKR